MESHKLFCPGYSGTTILLISASGVARIIGVSHQLLPSKASFLKRYCQVVTFKYLIMLFKNTLKRVQVSAAQVHFPI
jgi:hypothetical protein